MGFFEKKSELPNQFATKIELEKDYDFMYENFIVSSQRNLYLLLEENNKIIDTLNFEFLIFKFGYPNDEVGLPSKIKGVEIYGISEVHNSEWIKELMINNRSHSRHSDKNYSSYKHFIVRFKDVTLEVISTKYEILKMSKEEFNEIISEQISYLEKNVR